MLRLAEDCLYIPVMLTLALALLVGSSCIAANDRPYLFGMNHTPMQWWGYDGKLMNPALFRAMQKHGATICRIGVGWDSIEKQRGVYDWTESDYWVNLALDHNIEPLVLFGGTPEWALPEVSPRVTHPTARYPADKAYEADFIGFVKALAEHYKGRVRYYEFWNEANGFGWYSSQLVPPQYGKAEEYTPWMITAYKALKAVDSQAMMSTTGIDDNGDAGHGGNFLRQIYAQGGKGYFDAVADHPYSPQEFNSWKLDKIRNVLEENGDSHIKVWLTEYGYPMREQDYPAYSRFITDFYKTLTSDKYNYVTIATWHTANEFPWEKGYGLMHSDLSPKPPLEAWESFPKPKRPLISNMYVTRASDSSVDIRFTTDIPAKAVVMYGNDSNYGHATIRTAQPATKHRIALSDINPETIYHYRIRAGAHEDGDSFSNNMRFRLLDLK